MKINCTNRNGKKVNLQRFQFINYIKSIFAMGI